MVKGCVFDANKLVTEYGKTFGMENVTVRRSTTSTKRVLTHNVVVMSIVMCQDKNVHQNYITSIL